MNPQWQADVADPGRLVRAVYECISGAAGATRDWARFRYLQRPDALSLRTVVDSDGQTRSEVFTVDQYIDNVSGFFAENDFFEVEIAQRTERYGQIAHIWSRYEARPAPHSTTLLKRGANSIQLAFERDRWWVVSTIWDNDREGVSFDLF